MSESTDDRRISRRRRTFIWTAAILAVLCASYAAGYIFSGTVVRIFTHDHELLARVRWYQSPFLGRLFVPAAWMEETFTGRRVKIFASEDRDDGTRTIELEYPAEP